MSKEFLNIGHRGACGYAPENTLLSFKKALEFNVDMVELDVYALSSGELVVIHDETVDRTTNGKGYVWDFSFDEIRKLDAGEGEQVPTLNEVLDLIQRKCQVNIELKGEGTAEPTAKLIEDYLEKGWQYEDFLVSSFNHHELKKFKDLSPKTRTGALITAIPIDYAKFAEDLGAFSANLDIDFINKDFVQDAHQRGLKVYVFTVNTEEDIKRMKKLSVDGIFTNFPDRVN